MFLNDQFPLLHTVRLIKLYLLYFIFYSRIDSRHRLFKFENVAPELIALNWMFGKVAGFTEPGAYSEIRWGGRVWVLGGGGEIITHPVREAPPLKCLNMEGNQQFLLFSLFSPFSLICFLFSPFFLLKFGGLGQLQSQILSGRHVPPPPPWIRPFSEQCGSELIIIGGWGQEGEVWQLVNYFKNIGISTIS